ncbi:extracellular solute-binding protein [Halalkalibacter urbisdiaboli]|uniref:extracellular solute-binding protein n=1 Tax=Halalkalibacter urbisdiaboli TaxID=1960589 RepID=UPI000B454694|nr:extracellular solute-binding protein [Halalkalibacter urbisdiaboli]
MKNKIFFIITMMVLLMLVACTSPEEGSEEATEDMPEISIMMNVHTPEIPNDRIREMLEERTNVSLDIQWVPDSNYNDRLNAAFATGTLPDVVLMGFQTFIQYKDAIRDGQFWEIGPYIEDYDNLKKLNQEILDLTLVEDKLYTLYQGRPLSRQGIIYRKDWAERLGLSAPTTTDEFFEMARAFTEDDPDGNGKDDTIGLTDRSDLVYGAFKTVASWFGTPNEWGFKDETLLPEFMFNEYKDTLDFFKALNEKGYMNKDFPVTSKTDQQTMFKNGTAGMYVGSMEDVEGLYIEAKEINPNVEYDVHHYVEGPNGKYQVWGIPGFSTVVLFPKTAIKTEEELKQILHFYDQLMKPENMNLLIWGIEGEHYSVKDGKAVIAEDRKIFDNEVRPYLSLEIGEPKTNGRYERYHSYEPALKAQQLIDDNEDYIIQNPTVTLDSNTQLVDGERLQQMIYDATYKYILGQIDQDGFNDAIKEWESEGGSKMIEEFNNSYQEKNNK